MRASSFVVFIININILVLLPFAAPLPAEEAATGNDPVTLEMRGASLGEVLGEVTRQAGLSLVADERALAAGELTVRLEGVPARRVLMALDAVVESASVDYVGNGLVAVAFLEGAPQPLARPAPASASFDGLPRVPPPPLPPEVGHLPMAEPAPEPTKASADPLAGLDLDFPSFAEILLKSAFDSWNAGDAEEAEVFLSRALAEDPDLETHPEHAATIKAIKDR